MKKALFLLVIMVSFASCKCKTVALEQTQNHTITMLNDCYPNAKCSVDVFKDSALVIEKDEIGKLFYTLVSKKGSTVYQYQMTENKDEKYMDGGYREEIIFELPSNFKNGTISGKEILETKPLFGVFCYCKGKAGYYLINEGKITKSGEKISVEISKMVEGQKLSLVEFAK